MLTINNVTKKYGNFTALSDISLEFQNGVYGLLAPNGAGKTTLIKMLATLLFPTKGSILWDGEDIYAMDERYRMMLGYLPQKFGYYKNYSPKKFLMYLAALKGIPVKDAEIRIAELLNIVSLSDVTDKKMRKFSGGMLQRVGIASAMLNNPKILILDEPTAGLDPKERVRFRNIIHNLAKDRIVILSTHIVSDIETIANQVIMIKNHCLFCCETTVELCNRLKDKVFETIAGEELKGDILILGERQEGTKTMLRFVSNTKADNAKTNNSKTNNAIAVIPTLEDVFLYVYQEEREAL